MLAVLSRCMTAAAKLVQQYADAHCCPNHTLLAKVHATRNVLGLRQFLLPDW